MTAMLLAAICCPASSPAWKVQAMHASDNFKGICWMVAAMGAFALEDAFVKAAARHLPIGQLLMMFGLGGMLAFAAFPRRGGVGLLHVAARSKAMLVRAGFEFIGRLFYVLAIALTPLSTPVLVVPGASLYFGEKVGWRRAGSHAHDRPRRICF